MFEMFEIGAVHTWATLVDLKIAKFSKQFKAGNWEAQSPQPPAPSPQPQPSPVCRLPSPEILNIFNGKKSLIFSMRRTP